MIYNKRWSPHGHSSREMQVPCASQRWQRHHGTRCWQLWVCRVQGGVSVGWSRWASLQATISTTQHPQRIGADLVICDDGPAPATARPGPRLVSKLQLTTWGAGGIPGDRSRRGPVASRPRHRSLYRRSVMTKLIRRWIVRRLALLTSFTMQLYRTKLSFTRFSYTRDCLYWFSRYLWIYRNRTTVVQASRVLSVMDSVISEHFRWNVLLVKQISCSDYTAIFFVYAKSSSSQLFGTNSTPRKNIRLYADVNGVEKSKPIRVSRHMKTNPTCCICK